MSKTKSSRSLSRSSRTKSQSRTSSRSRSKSQSRTSQKTYKINRENGIYDPNGIHNNPLTNEPYKNIYSNVIKNINGVNIPSTYANFAKIWSTKIVYNNKDAIIDAITNSQIILATAGTGVGKTILVPRIALHAFDYKEKVICTIPKRLPARSTATFVAECMDVKLGEHVGYYYQGANETNKNGIESKLIFTTTGSIISRMTGNDPLLSDYKCIIVDEAHERSVDTDQLLLLLKKACQIRKDLKVIIMSATIDLQKFRNYYPSPLFKFGEVDAGSETTYEVKQHFMEKPKDWKAAAVDITMKLLTKTSEGDIMIFVKSGGDANQLCMGIAKAMGDFRKGFKKVSSKSKKKIKSISSSKTKSISSKTKKSIKSIKSMKSSKSIKPLPIIPPEYEINPFCIKLEGSSSKEDTDLATSMNLYKSKKDEKGYPYTRKVVISTNVAESSITVDGIVYIIDSGYEYAESYEPNVRARALLESMISQSAVIQRKGRAGRTRPGYCFHLYSKRDFENFSKYPIPSIEKSDITGNILNMMKLPSADTVKKMRSLLDEFISPPHEKFIINSLRTLQALGAITTLGDDGVITPMGLAICKFRSISPDLARSLIASHFYGVSRSVCDIIALAKAADGRIGTIFTKYYPDKRKTEEANRREFFKHKNIMRSFEHPYGDYMSMLKAYKMYLRVVGENKEKEILQKEQDALHEQQDNNVINENDIIPDIDELAEIDNNEQNDNHIKPGVKKWCRDNYVNARAFNEVRRVSRQLYQTLQLIVRPYQGDGNDRWNKKGQSRNVSKKEMKEAKSIMEVNSVLDELNPGVPIEMNLGKETQIMSGGYMRRIEEEEQAAKLEKNVKRFNNEDDNIMMALGIGNIVNLAIKIKGQRDTYTSCFAQVKKQCKFDRDTMLKGFPEIVMYGELFMGQVDARMLKLNLVNTIPDSVFNRIKENYGQYIKYCI